MFTDTPGLRNTEAKILSPTISCTMRSVREEKDEDIVEFEVKEEEVLVDPGITIPALSYIKAFYSNIAGLVSSAVLEKQEILGMPWITEEDVFKFPEVVEDGAIYFGQWHKDKRQGKGIQANCDGSLYSGEFYKNQYKGIGRLIYSNSEYYEGAFKKNKPNGQGCMTLLTCKKVSGNFHGEEVEGLCTITWKNAIFTGYLANGLRNGIGRLVQDEKVFEGEFVDDKIQGHGSCVWSNGKRYSGSWRDNKMHGFGVFEWPDGRVYEGKYINNMKHGFGKMTWPDGKSYEGEWVKGIQHGQASYTYFSKNSQTYETKKGRWFQGERVEWL